MGRLQIKWQDRALNRFDEIAEWYNKELGKKAAFKFVKGIFDTVETLSCFPAIGMIDQKRSTATKKYYTFLSHPNYRIIYRYTHRTLYVVAIQVARMQGR